MLVEPGMHTPAPVALLAFGVAWGKLLDVNRLRKTTWMVGVRRLHMSELPLFERSI